MIRGTLREFAAPLSAGLHGGDTAFAGVCTDTRSDCDARLFVALRGPNFDGHDYVGAAAEAGAAAALVEHALDLDLPQLIAADARWALGDLAHAWRCRHVAPLVAITGSNGKTTVKEMTAAILSQRGRMLATRGNLNNDIGLPLTLLDLDAADQAAVVEMGANHPGEIARLTAIAAPTIGVVTNAAPSHLEGFGSIEGVAHAKGELFAGMAPDAIAIVNRDDPYYELWSGLAGDRQTLSFGRAEDADFQCRHLHQGGGEGEPWLEFELYTPAGSARVELPLAGEHNGTNAAAAAAAAVAAGADLDDCVAGLRACAAAPGRLQLRPALSGARLIDDTYNANPSSMRAALEFLTAQGGTSVAVLGDMGELGAAGPQLHALVGEYARELGVLRVYALGDLSRELCAAFGAGALAFDDADALIAALRTDVSADTVVLVKGSRAMRMERVVAALQPPRAMGRG